MYSCEIIVITEDSLEASTRPPIHAFLPYLQTCEEELQRISDGGLVDRGGSIGGVVPGIYSILLCKLMLRTLLDKVKVHDLWLEGTIFYRF